MDINKLEEVVKANLSKDRFDHTIRVKETAISLATKYSCCTEKVTIAALFHDYAKCTPIEKLKEAINLYDLPTILLDFHHELWHGPVAAKIAERMFSIKDENILNAIYYHTTGRANMSMIELIIFVADYIEPGRSFPGVSDVRLLANENLKVAARKAIENTINLLMSKNATIFPDTFYAYNDLTKK